MTLEGLGGLVGLSPESCTWSLWFSRFGVRPENLRFGQVPGWCRCCWTGIRVWELLLHVHADARPPHCSVTYICRRHRARGSDPHRWAAECLRPAAVPSFICSQSTFGCSASHGDGGRAWEARPPACARPCAGLPVRASEPTRCGPAAAPAETPGCARARGPRFLPPRPRALPARHAVFHSRYDFISTCDYYTF